MYFERKYHPPRRGESSNAQICIPLTCRSDLDSIRLEDDVITAILSLFVLMIVRKSLRCVFPPIIFREDRGWNGWIPVEWGGRAPRHRDVRHVGSFSSESWTSDHCRSRPYEDIRTPDLHSCRLVRPRGEWFAILVRSTVFVRLHQTSSPVV